MFIDTLFATHCDLISTSLINSLLTDISNNTNYKGAAWRSGLHVWLVMWKSWIRAPLKAPVVS